MVDLLSLLGYEPIQKTRRDYWYRSPFRNEATASFKVNVDRNIWYDFGSGEGGGAIFFMKRYLSTDDTPKVMEKLKEMFMHPNLVSRETKTETPLNKSIYPAPHSSALRIVSTYPKITDELYYYALSRKIPIDVMTKFCCTVNLHNQRTGRDYRAIGFRNNSGGYELRNAYFKGCVGHKDVTTIAEYGKNICFVFEGFFDMLSFEVLWTEMFSQGDRIVMNSTSLVQKTIEALDGYGHICTLLDNDDTGRHTTSILTKEFPRKVEDLSYKFDEYNDLNDYLMKVK